MKLKLFLSIFLCGTGLHAQETNLGGSAGGGTDATLTLTDITTNNASTSKHGFLPKLDGNTAHFLNGNGALTTPAGTDLTAPGAIGSVTPSTVKATQYQATQSGSTAAGTPLTAFSLTPASSGASKFVFELGGANFGGVEDSVAYFGWNIASGDNRKDTSRSSIGLNIEDQYNDSAVDTTEIYFSSRDTTGTFGVRPIFFQMRRTPGSQNPQVRQSYILASDDNGLQIKQPDLTNLMVVAKGGLSYSSASAIAAGKAIQFTDDGSNTTLTRSGAGTTDQLIVSGFWNTSLNGSATITGSVNGAQQPKDPILAVSGPGANQSLISAYQRAYSSSTPVMWMNADNSGNLFLATGAPKQFRIAATAYNGTDLTVLPTGGIGLSSTTDKGPGCIVLSKVYYTSTVFDSAGTGSPESALTAGIGSTFRRTDGGASTSFYVKESGSGNTGWIAK